MWWTYSVVTVVIDKGGLGQDRTVDLTIFSRALVPTELPSRAI